MVAAPAPKTRGSIGDAIAQRAPRVLVGKDAKQAAFLQRLVPVGYWKYIGPKLAREIGKA